MKRAYLTNGTLIFPALPADNFVLVDDVTYNYLESLLDSDYCYLVLGGTEIIKILGLAPSNALYIQRFQDCRKTWLIGTRITYALTPNEIQDTLTEQVLNLVQDQAIQVDNNKISYPKVSILALGGIKVSDTPDVMIEDSDSMAGCIDDTPPEIPPQYNKIRIVDSGFRVIDSGGYRKYA